MPYVKCPGVKQQTNQQTYNLRKGIHFDAEAANEQDNNSHMNPVDFPNSVFSLAAHRRIVVILFLYNITTHPEPWAHGANLAVHAG